MKTHCSLLLLLALALLLPAKSHAITFHFKATAVFPVQTELPDPKDPLGATIVKKVTLGSKEIINLALGQDLKFKNPSNIVLAVALDHNDPDHAKLVVYDKTALVEIATVLTLLDPVDFNAGSKDGSKGAGNGLSRGRIAATTLGTPLINGFLQTDVCGAATGSKTPGPTGPTFKMSVTSIVGIFQANIDSVLLDGLIIKGSFSASGKPIDHL